jgi:prepilin-type N-terminal cleavage/methylation domain-containing protein
VEEKAEMKKQNRRHGSQAAFSLIELMIGMAVVLILSSAIAFAGGRVARAGRETTAVQNISTLASHEATFSQAWQGYSPAGVNLGGSEVLATVAATFAADQEISTAEAALLDAGYVNAGYSIIYKPGPNTFADSTGNTVSSSFEFTAIPTAIAQGTKAFCSDPSGSWFNTLGVGATVATGAGCKTDGYLSQ